MAEHPNVAIVRALFEAFRSADLATIEALVPTQAVWHFPGRKGQLAGDHAGRDAITAFLAKVVALSGGSFHLEMIDILANDSHAIALFRGLASRDGMTLDNPTCLRMRMVGGHIVEIWEFVWDLYAVEEFWA